MKAAPRKATHANPAAPFGLVGRCFHTFDARRAIEKQGMVRGDLGGEAYLVQYFEWAMGEPTVIEIKRLDDMKQWQFYEDTEHMMYWYKNCYRRPEP